MVALLLKCLLGALAVLLIALLSRASSFYLAGLVPLFPTFALIAHAMVGSAGMVQSMKVRGNISSRDASKSSGSW